MHNIIEQLGFSKSENIYKYTKNIDLDSLPLRINKSLHAMITSPKYIFILKNKPIILFFSKQTDSETIFKQCWNFSETPIVIIENSVNFNVYNGYEYILKDGSFLLNPIDKASLNYISIMSGEYIQQTNFKCQNNKVDKVLLENIKEAREKLIYELVANDIQEKRKYNKDKKAYEYKNLNTYQQKEYEAKKNIANSLIGRIIFIRYLIDRGVSIGFRKKEEKLSNEALINIFGSHSESYELFKYLKSEKGFNGDWFPIVEDEENIVQINHLIILQSLISGFNFKNNQGTLFNFYDFSIIPIEFISNVYESFIGEEEQSKNGAYYTPTFLVDYILKYTIDDFFKTNPNEYNCKVLDPACGSGIFLVETLRKLINQYKKIENDLTPEIIVKLVEDNIFAIDKDRNAILISVFSLYLTMLDYQSPKDIEKFKFPYLIKSIKNPNPNFFENDFFDTNADFNTILQQTKINYIIGNPPYGRGTIKKNSFADKYVKSNNLSVGNQDLVQPFLIRVKDLSSDTTNVSFIVTSKVLYNLQTKKFRVNNFLNNFKIKHILELSSVRKEIFENADVPVCILFYRYSTKKEAILNTINYISMKPSPYFNKLKIFTIAKTDFKEVLQSKLIEYDYLWKILVYGSYLDFNLIKKLKNSYDSIYKVCEDNKYPKGMGIQATKGNFDIPEHMGKDFINIPRGKSSERYMSSFYIASKLPKWDILKVHRKGECKLFKSNSVLITRGVDTKTLKAKAAVLDRNAVFKHTLTGVNVPTLDIAKNFVGLINSSFFAYYNLEMASSIGIEREQLHDEEKLQVPYLKSKKIITHVKKIENLKKAHFDTSSSNIFEYDKDILALTTKLDSLILKEFKLDDKELSLVDYATNIIIPWVIQKKYDIAFKKFIYKDKQLEEYANIFIKHYSKIYELNNIYFKVEILYNDYAIGMKFKTTDNKHCANITWQYEKNLDNFIKLTGNHSLENLFIQKDIKGFEADYFYIIKPNEHKNWHKAIGYLDFYEFDDAILEAGKQQ